MAHLNAALKEPTRPPGKLASPPTSREDFWRMVDEVEARTEQEAREKFAPLEWMSPDDVRRVLVQYRFFANQYIQDLAMLVAKVPFGRMRTFLASILSEELGGADAKAGHGVLYDDFLLSIGVQDPGLELIRPKNKRLLDQISEDIVTAPFAVGIGLRGLGGECICQKYLEVLYQCFTRNPFIASRRDQVSWRFWEIHVGPIDIHHREQTREILDELLSTESRLCSQIADGYTASMRAWDGFWTNIFEGEGQEQ
jgi:hypothetical protein